jgi:ribonuclease D
MQWTTFEKDLRAMSDPENYQVDKSQLWRRLKGVLKLKDEKLQIASDLCRWREDLAQQQNRPRRWIAKDDALVEIARQKPEDFEALARIPELSEKTARRYGDELLKIIVQAERVDPTRWPQHDKSRSLSKQQLALGDFLNQKSSRLTQGWRFSMAGEQLLEFIHGQSAISVDNEDLKLDPK